MQLGNWSDDQKDEFAFYLAKAFSARAAWKKMVEQEDVHQYSYVIVAKYANSEDCRERRIRAQDKIREEVKDLTFSHSGSRIDTLIEVGSKLLAAFRASTKVAEMTKLAAELRQTLTDIRQEIDPYGIENQQTRSHFENILLGVQGLPNQQRQMILGATSSKPISETPSN